MFAHGFTYSGHPLACAVALKTIEIYERIRIVEHVQRMAPIFELRLKALAEHPLVGEARGVGLIGAVELVRDKDTRESFDPADGVAAYAGRCAQARGVITRGMGDAVNLCPPLIITETQVDDLLARIELALDDTLAWVREKRLGVNRRAEERDRTTHANPSRKEVS